MFVRRPASQPEYAEGSAKRRKALPRAAAVAGASRAGPHKKPEFEPDVEDSKSVKELRSTYWETRNSHVLTRGRYGDISYAKSWCGFAHPRRLTKLYKSWREHIKGYITTRGWDPTSLSEAQLDSVTSFAGSLPPVAGRIKEIEARYRPDGVAELVRQMKVLVKERVKKLQTTNERRNAGDDGGGDVIGRMSKYYALCVLNYHSTNKYS
jgi:hypothetical protein